MTAGRNIVTQSQSWGTPVKYVKAVKKFFGGDIDLDPCSNKFSIVDALNEFMLPNQDGLELNWNFKRIFVNPPYGIDKERKTSIKNWISKCSHANSEFKSEVIALIPVAVNTSHWKKYIFTKATAVCFLYDTRLKFLENGVDTGKGAPMACAIVYWGSEYELFYKTFIEYGAVVNITNLKNEKIGNDRLFAGESIFNL
jgi:DNA N-6-adenine-methyltransferase (Dam)